MILAYRHLRVALTSRRNGRSRGTFQKAMLFCKPGGYGQKVVSLSPQTVKWLRRNKPETQSLSRNSYASQVRFHLWKGSLLIAKYGPHTGCHPLSSDIWPECVRLCLGTGFCAVLSRSWKVTDADIRNGHVLCKCDVFWGQNSWNVWVMSAGRPLQLDVNLAALYGEKAKATWHFMIQNFLNVGACLFRRHCCCHCVADRQNNSCSHCVHPLRTASLRHNSPASVRTTIKPL